MHTAKLFINGRNQAIRIPKAMEFKGVNEVTIRREGQRLILEPCRKSWVSFAAKPLAGDDFMAERPELMDNGRVKF